MEITGSIWDLYFEWFAFNLFELEMQDYNIIKQLTSSIFTRQKVKFENDSVMTTSGIQENKSEAATGGHSVK